MHMLKASFPHKVPLITVSSATVAARLGVVDKPLALYTGVPSSNYGPFSHPDETLSQLP